MREVIARFADDSDFLDFKPDYGPATVCGHAAVQGFAVGIVTNNGPLDPAGATKATHFIQACCQAGLPILYLQNTTGYIVGKASEEAGMIKHGSKMIQAVSNANVPQITLMCGASFGAGNYGMCGRAYNPRFLFSWPNAQTAVMGAEQAALTMANVMEAGARRKGQEPDAAQIDALKKKIVDNFESQSSAFVTSRAHARRRHHRSARHAQRARLHALDLPRGGRAHAAAGAVRRGAAMKSLLIANRGEIARRIMRTARRMGLRTIAVYSDADRDALHVREADAAVRIGGAAPRESYLNIAAIIEAAKRTRRRRGASGLRLPRRECGLRASRDRCGTDLGRAAARCHPPDGRQGRGEAHRARGRRADHSGLPSRTIRATAALTAAASASAIR